MRMLPDGFRCDERDGVLVVHYAASGAWLAHLLAGAPRGFPDAEAILLSGGRGATYRVTQSGHRIVVRCGRRGGLPGRFVRETYLGRRPRVLDELAVTEKLRGMGIPVAAPLGAVVVWRWPLCYRSWLATEWIDNVGTLWSWLSRPTQERARAHVLRAVGHAVRGMHDAGVVHPDLNLSNFLVCDDSRRPVVLIDFDRARAVVPRSVGLDELLGRLRRSAARLDPGGSSVKPSDYAHIAAGYEGRDA